MATLTYKPQPFFKVSPRERTIDKEWEEFSASPEFTDSDESTQIDMREKFIRSNVMPHIVDHSKAAQTIETFYQTHRTPKELISKDINIRGTPFESFRRQTPKIDDWSGLPLTHSHLLQNFGGAEDAREKRNVLEAQGLVNRDDYYMDEDVNFVLTPKGQEKLGIEPKRPGYDLSVVPKPLKLEAVPRNARQGARLAGELTIAVLSRGANVIPASLRMFLGSAGLKYLDEGVEYLQGYQEQTLKSVSADAMIEGAIASGAEWITRLSSMLGGYAKSGGAARLSPEGESFLNPFKRESWGGGDTGTMINPLSKRNIQAVTGIRDELMTSETKDATIEKALASGVDPNIMRPFGEPPPPKGYSPKAVANQLLSKVGKRIGKGGILGKGSDYRWGDMRSLVDPDVRETVEKALALGLVPDISSLKEVGHSRLASVIQGIGKMFGMGKARDQKNAKVAMQYLIDLEKQLPKSGRAGVPEISVSELSKGLRKNVGAVQKRLEDAPQKTLNQVNVMLKNAEKIILQNLKGRKGGLAPGASQDNVMLLTEAYINEAYKMGARKGSGLYKDVDRILEEAGLTSTRLIPTKVFKEYAQSMLNKMPKTLVKDKETAAGNIQMKEEPFLASGEFISEMKKMVNMTDKMTFSQAQHFRELMTQKAYDKDLMSTVGEYHAKQFKDLMDGVFDDVLRSTKDDGKTAMTKESIRALRKANDYWSKFKRGYDNTEIMNIVQKGGQDKYGMVVRMDGMTPDQVGNIMRPLNEGLRNSIRLEHFKYMVRSSSDESTGFTSGQALLKSIVKMKEGGNSFYKLYGQDANAIESYARSLAMRNYKGKLGTVITDEILEAQATRGKIGARGEPRVKELMQQALKETDDAKKYASDNIVKILEAEDPKRLNNLFDVMLRPDGEGVFLIDRMERILADSPQKMEQLRIKAYRNMVLNALKGRGPEKYMAKSLGKEREKRYEDILFDGDAILDMTTRQYAGAKKDNAFIRMFGEPFTKELTEYARAIKTVGGKLPESIVERWMAMHPFDNLDKLTRFKIMSHILAKPAVLNMFLKGHKRTKTSRFGETFVRTMSQSLANMTQEMETSERTADRSNYMAREQEQRWD